MAGNKLQIISLRKKLLFLLIIILCGIFLFILGYEAYSNIRYYKWKKGFSGNSYIKLITVRSPNNALIWEYRPYGEFDIIKINRYGFRDLDYATKAKPPGITRVVFLGDSVTVGLKANFDSIFTRQFEKLLNRNNLQSLNVAVDGYDVRQITELMRAKAIDFNPDKIYYMICLNDFDFEDTSSLKTKYFRKPTSFFLEGIRKAPRKVKELFGKNYLDCFFDQNKSVFYENILTMNKLCSDKNISFEAVIVPAIPEKGGFKGYQYTRIHKEIDSFLKGSSINHTDLLDDFSKASINPKDFFIDCWHLNEKGHYLTAKIISQKFENNHPQK